MAKKLVVFTGSGISEESGISTFRGSGGLWEEHSIEEVATPEAWQRDFRKVLEFYNKRRRQLHEVRPNPAHYALTRLEEQYNVHVITQNIDDLHERAGSKNVLHLHGELKKARSEVNENEIYEIKGTDIRPGDTDSKGRQLRPHVVWFGEAVPNMIPAMELVEEADILLVIGTSLNVYPAAGLVEMTKPSAEIHIVDPELLDISHIPNAHLHREKAAKAVPEIVDKLMQ